MIGEILDDDAELARLREPWDALAVAAGRPLAAPAWLLSWWRNMAPRNAALRTVVVRDADRVVGLAPYFVERRHGIAVYRPLGSEMAIRCTPLAAAGHDRQVARAVAAALAAASPRPAAVDLDQIDVTSPWPGLLADAWPGDRMPRRLRRRVSPAPTMRLRESSYEAWLGGKSKNFRQRIRRDMRKLAASGAQIRLAQTPDDLRRALTAFGRLHGDRWGDASPLSSPAGRQMMLDAGLELLAGGRFRAWTIERDGSPITVQLFVAAGGEVAYWNGAWDPAFAALSPAILGLCAAIADAFARGERRVDLGAGSQHYKTRLADGDEEIGWYRLYPHGSGHLRALSLLALPERAETAARAAAGRLPPRARAAVARLRSADLPGSRDAGSE